ncbi:DNA replication factor GINS [Halorubrum trapanicum]|uniref:DNA replication factor GINS n=1 Tax=Halorubrum trapanicum TaxID=29284 RepID=A0A8J7R9V7_9EURY|nr:hypothetical protein [Halorubrum trapanicum]MBP1903336.1 DNA replication factor GINS [Halorubrum trapanicum]
MNLDELRSAQAKERRKDSLQHLRDSFYDDVGAYVADLRAARDRRAEQVDNPFEDDDVRRLSDEVETAEEVAEALYERRVGKVVKLASFAAADMSVDEEGMTTEERRLFDDLVDRITANKSQVLDVLAGESPVPDEPAISDESPVSDEPEQPAGAGQTPAVEEPQPTADTEATGSERTESPPADTGALAGAMGGDDGESSPDASPESREGDELPPSGSAEEDDGGTTPVPPDPAPPGAVGVDAESGETDGLGDAAPAAADLADDAEGEPDPGATTDGGAVPEAAAANEPGVESGPGESPDRATVRITRDVGAIFGVDEREYELASEDVVSLPVENADPLVQRDAADRID